MIRTERLVLRPWLDADLDAFAALHGDPDVMRDLRGPIDRAAAAAKLAQYRAGYDRVGYSRWAVERSQGSFVGYVGAVHQPAPHPLGQHDEIGWRIHKAFWGQGFAVEGAEAALKDLFGRTDRTEVLSYTAPGNTKSKAVMLKLGLRRDAAMDFSVDDPDIGLWRGQVWVADRDRYCV